MLLKPTHRVRSLGVIDLLPMLLAIHSLISCGLALLTSNEEVGKGHFFRGQWLGKYSDLLKHEHLVCPFRPVRQLFERSATGALYQFLFPNTSGIHADATNPHAAMRLSQNLVQHDLKVVETFRDFLSLFGSTGRIAHEIDTNFVVITFDQGI